MKNGKFKKTMRRFVSACLVFVSLMQVSGSWGLGLSTPFGLVTVENLQPGQTYNTRELANLPLAITNTSDHPVEVEIAVHSPEPHIYPGMTAAGFEPIPDVSWVALSQSQMTIQPGQSVATDVMITVPDDDKYLGKRYQVQIQSRTTGKRFLSAGLNSTLRFTVAYRRATPEELAQRKKVEGLREVDFDVLPRVVELKNVQLGKKIKIDLKLSNTNNEDFTFYLQSVTPRDLHMTDGRKALGAPDTAYLILPKKELRVKANTIQPFSVFLNIPPQEEYRGKQYVFLLKVELPGVTTILNQVVRIYAATEN